MSLQVGLTRALIYDEAHAPVPESIGINAEFEVQDDYPSEGLMSDTSSGSMSIVLTEGQEYSILVACSKWFGEVCDTWIECKQSFQCY